SSRRRPRPVLVALVLAVSPLLVACGGQSPAPSPSATVPVPVETPSPTPTPTPEPWTSVIGTSSAESVEVFAEAGATAPERVIAAAEVVSLPGQIPVTFLVLAQE